MSHPLGLSIRVRLLRSLPARYKVDIFLKPGSHMSELSGESQLQNQALSIRLCDLTDGHVVNKQLNDKERVAAALENPHIVKTLEQCLESATRRGVPAD
jgi:hypothetical protein